MYIFLQVFWISVLGASSVSGYFLGDTKAVLYGCKDHWTLQDRTAMPLLYRMTVCVDVRLVDPGAWVAFTYSSAHVPRPGLGLEGDAGALYGWLLGVRHRFPVSLALGRWHRVCLRRDVPGNSFSLELDGRLVAERTVIAQAIPPSGSLWLGCRRQAPGEALGRLEVYMFRMWADLARRGACEDGAVIGWDAHFWGVTSPRARQTDDGLPCAQTPELGHSFSPPPLLTSTMDTSQPPSVIVASSGHVDKPLPMTLPTTTLLATTTSATIPVSPLAPPSSSILTNQILIITTVPPTKSPALADQTTPTTVPHPTSADIPTSTLAPPTSPSLANQESRSSKAPPTRSFAPADQTSLIAATNADVRTSTLVPPPSPILANQESSSTQAPPTAQQTTPKPLPLVAFTTINEKVPASTLSPPSRPNSTNQVSSTTQAPPSTLSGSRPCDCTASCTTTSQFFAMRVNINSAAVNVDALQHLLSRLPCSPISGCKDYPDILQHFQGVHLECDGTHQRLNSCMVIVEVSGPVDGCSLGPLLKELIGSYAGVTGQTALARMVVCGSPGVPLHRLLASNLSWSAHTLLMSDICRHDTDLLQCETNQTRAVLLADSCSPSLTLPPAAIHEAKPTAATDLDISAGAASANITTHQNLTPSLAVTTQTSATVSAPSANVTTLSSHDATVSSTAPLPNGTTATERHVTNAIGNEHTTQLNATSTTKRTAGPQHNSTLPDDSQTLATTSSNNVAPSAPLIMADMTTNLNNAANSSDEPALILLTFPAQNDNTAMTTAGPIVTSSASPGTKTPPEGQVDKLLERTQDSSQLNSSQVADVVDQLEKLLDAATVSQAVGRKAISIVSHLMEVDPRVLSASSNRIIRLVEDLGLKLVVSGVSVVLSSGSLVLAVQKVDGSNFPEMFVNIYNTKDVELSVPSRSESRRRDSIIGSVYLPSSISGALTPAEKMQVQRVQFTFYTKPILFQDDTLNNQTVVSPVLASSVGNLSVSNLTENVSFTIQNLHPVHANYEVTCAFWDFTGNGGTGGWSSAGCFVVNSTSWGTTCTCNHLTSFAVLLDLSREGVSDPQQAQILTFITYIGCGLSAVFLAATLLTYLSFEKLLRDIPSKILVQLCFSLLFLNLVYLLDGWLALYPAGGLCISTAFFLHYFLLTSFTWAGLEALHMYLSIVQVFTPYLSRYMLKFSLVGWGAPVVVVTVVISVDKDNYGLVTYGRYTDGTSDDFCWLRSDTAFYVGVVTYFLLIFTSCLLVFAVVMVQLSRIKRQNPHNQSPHRGLVTDLRSVVGLVVLLGLAWGFALLAWGPLHLPFVYLFTIFNSLQGFLVFVFHCACKENVRRQWRTYLCCGHLRLAKNSEWSRTATRNRNFSATTSSALAPRQLSSRSSSVASNITSSSSVFVDSGLSDGSSSDVILNELHRQTASL
ncbi:uncharacterized protein adgrg2a [Nerophis lumbriciformis]|uniref:uncharacterized protein adgrg2a n=1 Tax=Nerophis lumbriciformis TaxID=546530 RepID=UPI002AE02081|nr:adhesion G-protein coupled receptor G4-like [Nerophis lumbriciformis]